MTFNTAINLRAWREERDMARQKTFAGTIAACVVVSGALIFAMASYYDWQSKRQKDRNQYLETKMVVLDKKLSDIQELRRQRERLLERLNAIAELQGNRPVIVRYFDELVRVMPDGLYYDTIERQANQLTIKGYAKHNNDISTLMRRFDESVWFKNPNLSHSFNYEGMRKFSLTVPLTKPNTKGEE